MAKKNKKSLEKVIDLKIKKHTNNYIHIPMSALLPLVGTLLAGLLTWANLQVIFSLWTRLGIGVIFEATNPIPVPLYSWGIIPVLILEYVLISATILSINALWKGSYENIRESLIVWLIRGLIIGLIGGLIGGLIVGLTQKRDFLFTYNTCERNTS